MDERGNWGSGMNRNGGGAIRCGESRVGGGLGEKTEIGRGGISETSRRHWKGETPQSLWR